MSDGLHIRWRETAPDRGLLSFALAELEVMHGSWPETLQCNIIVEPAPSASDSERRYQTHLELDLGRRSPRVKAHALGEDLYSTLRSAFKDARASMPAYEGAAEDEVAA